MKHRLILITAVLFAAMPLLAVIAGEPKESVPGNQKTVVQLPEQFRGKWTAALRSADGVKRAGKTEPPTILLSARLEVFPVQAEVGIINDLPAGTRRFGRESGGLSLQLVAL